MKEDQDATIHRLDKENAELKEKEVLARKLAIKEYKSSDDFHEAVVKTTFEYYSEGFDLNKK